MNNTLNSYEYLKRLSETYKDLTIINCYGPTECVTFTNTFRVDETRTVKVPLGKAISNTYGYVIDKKFRLLPLYVEGEYILGGDSVGIKYINNEELTKEKKFREDLYYRINGINIEKFDRNILQKYIAPVFSEQLFC